MSDINRIRSNINNYYNKKKEEYTQYRIQKHNDYWNKYYQDIRWKKLRDYYRLLHPICEVCEKEGIVVPAEHVHHIHPFSKGLTEEAKYNLLLNPDNLCSVCKSCHKIIHNIMKQQNKDYVTIDEAVQYKQQYDINSL